jgi:Ca-activated chloride channel family protein
VLGFSHPWMLLLALVPLSMPFMRGLPQLRRRGHVSLPTYDWMPAFAVGSSRMRWLGDITRILALFCLILIAAGIRSGRVVSVEVEQPEAMVIVLDISSSMTAEDFSPGNRLEAAKNLLATFASSRSNSAIGLILLAASPRLIVPITDETRALPDLLKNVRSAGFGEDGTAIGSGIASAVNRLRDGPWTKRRILLVTDGVNNRGSLAPSDAARLAAGMGIRVDTIGIGSDSVSRYWLPSAQGPPIEIKARIQIDDKALEEVSTIAGGRYQRVTNSDELDRALQTLMSATPELAVAASIRFDYLWMQVLAAASILLICFEFCLTRFICPELPG